MPDGSANLRRVAAKSGWPGQKMFSPRELDSRRVVHGTRPSDFFSLSRRRQKWKDLQIRCEIMTTPRHHRISSTNFKMLWADMSWIPLVSLPMMSCLDHENHLHVFGFGERSVTIPVVRTECFPQLHFSSSVPNRSRTRQPDGTRRAS